MLLNMQIVISEFFGTKLAYNAVLADEEQQYVACSQTYNTQDDTYAHHLLLVDKASGMCQGIWGVLRWAVSLPEMS